MADIWSGHELFAKDTALIFAGYLIWKLVVVRNLVPNGTKPDPKKGWGSETYFAAAGHQVVTAAVWFHLLYSHRNDMGDWLKNTWDADTSLMAGERFIMLSNIAEVVTDCMVYPHYAGFGFSFWWHHVSTALCTAAFLLCKAPAGYTVSYGSAMEVGGLSLNAVNIYPTPFTYNLRAIIYSLSRLTSTFLLSLVTYEAYQGSMVFPAWALLPAWALCMVNWFWMSAVIMSAFRSPKKGAGKKKKQK